MRLLYYRAEDSHLVGCLFLVLVGSRTTNPNANDVMIEGAGGVARSRADVSRCHVRIVERDGVYVALRNSVVLVVDLDARDVREWDVVDAWVDRVTRAGAGDVLDA